MKPLKDAFADHSRRWRDFRYVYPVIARRSHGLSIGVNLNPDGACSFDCVYCSVDRTDARPAIRTVDTAVLEAELRQLAVAHAQLFDEPEFRAVPPEYRRLNDIAFSGDGEPTAVPVFPEAVRIATDVRRDYSLAHVKIVVITNACYLARPAVAGALAVLDQNGGEIWAKLDAGTEEHFRQINRSAFPLQHVLDNILAAGRGRPLVLQSMFLRLRGAAPEMSEIAAYVERIRWLLAGGARFSLIQIYTIARRTAESFATPLTPDELEQIAASVRPLGVPVAVFT